MRIRGYPELPGHQEPLKWRGSMKARQDSMGDQELGTIDCVFRIMR